MTLQKRFSPLESFQEGRREQNDSLLTHHRIPQQSFVESEEDALVASDRLEVLLHDGCVVVPEDPRLAEQHEHLLQSFGLSHVGSARGSSLAGGAGGREGADSIRAGGGKRHDLDGQGFSELREESVTQLGKYSLQKVS